MRGSTSTTSTAGAGSPTRSTRRWPRSAASWRPASAAAASRPTNLAAKARETRACAARNGSGPLPVLPDGVVARGPEDVGDLGGGARVGDLELGLGLAGRGVAAGLGVGAGRHVGDAQPHQRVAQL